MPSVNIAGHQMTEAQLKAVDELREYLKAHSGDTGWQPGYSPMGDGQWVRLTDVWPRGGKSTGRRVSIGRLHSLGVLRACEIALVDGEAKGMPYHRVEAEESARHAANRRSLQPA